MTLSGVKTSGITPISAALPPTYRSSPEAWDTKGAATNWPVATAE